MSRTRTYFATEFGSCSPTRSFERAERAACREADIRRCPVWIFENGKAIMRIHPARRSEATR